MLVDRFKRDLFRYVCHKGKNGLPDRIITTSYDFESGMAGYVALSCHTLYADKVQEEVRYAPEVDDPRTITEESLEPARQMISCPVFTKMDKEELAGKQDKDGNGGSSSQQ